MHAGHTGGLLSTHVLLKRAPEAVPGYSDGLLALGARLGDALMPAFATPSGVPLSWVNLKRVRTFSLCRGCVAV